MTNSWHHTDTIVFGPAVAPAVGTTGYNQLVLTPYVPDDMRVGVILIVEDLTAGSNYFAFRPSDDDDDYLDSGNGPHGLSTGISLGTTNPSPAALAVITFTGPTGVVDWVAQNAQSARVTLAGWFDADFDNVLLFDPAPIIPPNEWQIVPGLMAAIGYVRKLAFLKFKRAIGSSGAVGLRTREPLGDPPLWWEPDASYAGGSTIHQANVAQTATLAALSTGSTGMADWQATSPPPLISAWLSHTNYEPWRICNCKIYPSNGVPAPPPTTWTDIDLSAIFGRRHVLCGIEVRHEFGATGVPNRYAFRPKGASWDTLGGTAAQDPGGCSRVTAERAVLPGQASAPRYRLIWVESDSNGVIQWIAGSGDFGVELYLQGWIEGEAGVSTSLVGAPFPPDYQIPLVLTNDVGVILASIYVALVAPDGVTEYAVIEDGDWVPSWDGTITPNDENGYDILIETIWTDVVGAEGRLYVVGDWAVIVEADLIGGGSIRTEIIIPIDTNVPTLQVADRSQLEVVTPDSTRTMRFRITDLWGFDIDTLGLTATPKVTKTTNLDPGQQGISITIIDGGVIQSGFTGSIIPNGEDLLGYDVIVRGLPDFYDPCTWDLTWEGASIVEKEFSEESLL